MRVNAVKSSAISQLLIQIIWIVLAANSPESDVFGLQRVQGGN